MKQASWKQHRREEAAVVASKHSSHRGGTGIIATVCHPLLHLWSYTPSVSMYIVRYFADVYSNSRMPTHKDYGIVVNDIH